MFRLITAPDIVMATLWCDLLQEAGIEAHVQRAHLGALAGQMPPDQCLPEIWLAHPLQEGQARELLQQLEHLPQRRWRCICGEQVEGGFEQCWSCDRPMPLADAS